MADVPYTWEEMRSRFEPTMEASACEICRHIPAAWLQRPFPDASTRLEIVGFPDEAFATNPPSGWRRECCPICHQLYRRKVEIPWNQLDPYNPDAAGPPYEVLHRTDAAVELGELVRYRVMDDRFARALAVIDPALDLAIRTRGDHASLWKRHQVVRIDCGPRRRWVILSYDGDVHPCTLAEIARVVRVDPPERIDTGLKAQGYARWVDLATDVYARTQTISKFDGIPWRSELTDAERAHIEELRRASRVEPEHVAQVGDRFVIRSWMIADHKLICRVLTVSPIGEVDREDAVIAERLPTLP